MESSHIEPKRNKTKSFINYEDIRDEIDEDLDVM
jgi:hypothetical protein